LAGKQEPARSGVSVAGPARELIEITEGHLEFARKQARKFWHKVAPKYRDDLESAACAALISARNGFDPSTGKPFEAYAGVAIRRHVARELIRIENERVPFEALSETSRVNRSSVRSLDEAPDRRRDPQFSADDIGQIPRYLNALPADLREIVRSHFLDGVSQSDIARSKGVEPYVICRKVERAKEIMQAAAAAPRAKDFFGHDVVEEAAQYQAGDIVIEERGPDFVVVLHGPADVKTILATGTEAHVERFVREYRPAPF
jgi:RNA polymerase sigma factor (sigma-70 family)